jgi:ParB family transcriptional regulator, chromosome partitioning protein
MGSIISMDPFRCRVWKLHDRLEDYITEQSCREEIASFLQRGQLIPVLGRPAAPGLDYDVELIYGARRLFVARLVNKPLLVDLRDLSDREAAIALDVENRQRKDVSPYERGLCYARWLRAGHFQSQEEIAEVLNVSRSQVSRLLKLARLPSCVVGAFNSGADICERWGLELTEVLEDPPRRTLLLQRARTIGSLSPKPPAAAVFRQLLAASGQSRKRRAETHDKVVRGDDGVPLFRVREQRESIALILPVNRISRAMLESIENAIADILEQQLSTSPRHAAREIELRAD